MFLEETRRAQAVLAILGTGVLYPGSRSRCTEVSAPAVPHKVPGGRLLVQQSLRSIIGRRRNLRTSPGPSVFCRGQKWEVVLGGAAGRFVGFLTHVL